MINEHPFFQDLSRRYEGFCRLDRRACRFGAGFLVPLPFGLVLDLAGGSDRVMSWGLAFAALGFWSLVTAIVHRLRKEKRPSVSDQPTTG